MDKNSLPRHQTVESKDRDQLIQALGHELSALMSASRSVAAEAAACVDPSISGSAFQMLQGLHAYGATKPSVLAEALSMDRSVVSRVVKSLVKLGLVIINSDSADARSVTYDLTPIGRLRVADAIAQKGNLFVSRVSAWPASDLVQLTSLLSRLNGRDA